MSTTEIIAMFEQLPAEKQREIEKLLSEMTSYPSVGEAKKPRMKFGDLKGFVKHMSDDFDEPMDRGTKREFGGGKDIFGDMSDDFNEPLNELKDYI